MGQAISTYFYGTEVVWKNSNPISFHCSASEYDLEAYHMEQITKMYHQNYNSDSIKQYLIQKLIENKIAFEKNFMSNCIRLPRDNVFDYIYFRSDNITYVTYAKKSLKSTTINIDLTQQCNEQNSINVVEQIIAAIKTV